MNLGFGDGKTSVIVALRVMVWESRNPGVFFFFNYSEIDEVLAFKRSGSFPHTTFKEWHLFFQNTCLNLHF